MLVPLGVVHATITGTPILGVADHYAVAPTAFTPYTTSVDVIAGTPNVAPVATGCDGGPCAYTPSYFAMNFNGVTFSGATFYLYLSENGLSNVNTTAGDVQYAGPFAANALTTAEQKVSVGLASGIVGANYWIGNVGAGGTVVGPIPVQISTKYQYVKVYDGSCGASPTFCGGTGIAGAKQLVNVQPGITITPTKGPAWTSVLVSGGGFQANAKVDINYSFTYFNWETAAGSLKTGTVTTGIATGQGFFSSVPMSMVDTGQAWNINGGPFNPTPITLTAVNSSTYQGSHDADDVVLNSAQNTVAPVIFNEFARQFNQMESWFSGSVVQISPYHVNNAAAGNATCESAVPNSAGCAPAPKYSSLAGNASGTYLTLQPLQVYVTGMVGIIGSNFTVNGPVSIYLGGVLVGTVTANSIGHFVANVTVPKLPVGLNIAKTVANGVDYQFDIFVNPTLLLTPDSGAIGSETGSTPTVTVTAYGFPANSWVSLWWLGYTSTDTTNYFLLNSTVDSTGSYNHTITFVVPPEVNGGGHEVTASTHNWSPTVDESLLEGAGFVTEATFTILPTISISPTSVSANQKGWFTVDGDGFDNSKLYYVQIDNSLALSGAPGLQPGTNGDLIINFTSTGFRPGTHQIELYDWTTALGSGSYAPTVWAYFNVTITGDLEGNAVASVQTSLTSIQTSLTAVQTSLSSVQTSLTSITSSLTAIQSSLTSITSTLTGVTSSLTSISSTLTGISGSLSSIQASLTTITGDVSGLGSQLTSIQQSATAIQSAASSLTTSVGTLGSQLTNVQSTLTSMQGTLTSIAADAHTAATQATAGAASAANAVTGNSTAQTYVLVVAVLAAITLVLELAILVRKLS
jgi:hypothetical protein